MAIKNLFGRGVGFNGGEIHWVVTRGYGVGGSPTPTTGNVNNRRWLFRHFHPLLALFLP